MDVRIKSTVVPDDGSDGIFWRDGLRYVREGKRESMIAHLAPHQEEKFMKDLDSEMGRIGMRHERRARDLSREPEMERSSAVRLEIAAVMSAWQLTPDEFIDVIGRQMAERANEFQASTHGSDQFISAALRSAADKLSGAAADVFSASQAEKLKA